jgi:hypothetical protein
MRLSDAVWFFVLPCFYWYCAVASKLLPATGIRVLDAIAADRYYVLLVPLCLPVAVSFVFCNWLGLKYFRAN